MIIKDNIIVDINELNESCTKAYKNMDKDILNESEIVHLDESLSNDKLSNPANMIQALKSGSLKKLFDSKYKLKTKIIASQTKEINDIYTKINDLLKNDRDARKKHAHDTINYISHTVLLKKKNSKDDSVYNLIVDVLGYNTEYFIESINDVLETYAEDKEQAKEKLKAYITSVENYFNQYYSYTKFYTPIHDEYEIKNIYLEKAILKIKNNAEIHYSNIYVLNEMASATTIYLQDMELAYKTVSQRYSSLGKDAKKLIDELFNIPLQHFKIVMDYINAVIDASIECFVGTYEELEKIYEILRS